MGKLPQLLFLGQTLPFPPDSGVTIRAYNIFRQLTRKFDVTIICFYRQELVGDRLQASLRSLRNFAQVDCFPIPQEHSTPRLLWDHMRSSLSATVYTRYVYESEYFARTLERTLSARDFQVIHADSLDLSRYFSTVSHYPLVCVHHNVESRLLQRRSEAASNPVYAAYLRYQARLMKKEEELWCPSVDLNVTVSEEDRTSLIARTGGESNFTIVPNGVDVDYYHPTDAKPQEDIVSVGGVEWLPNRDALEFFTEDILWRIRRHRKNASVVWVGRCPDDLRRTYYDDHRINLTGYVEDIRPYLSQAKCFVVPLRIGSGTRLKILTAWSMGLPVISTSIGCEGLQAKDGENIIVRDEPSDFATAVNTVLNNPRLRRRLGNSARETAVSVYSWERIGDEMLDDYLSLL